MSKKMEVERFSREKRPEVGMFVRFSPGIILSRNNVNPRQPIPERSGKAKVVGNMEFTTEVLFDGEKETDIVTPEFLIPCKLMKEEKKKFLLMMKGVRV